MKSIDAGAKRISLKLPSQILAQTAKNILLNQLQRITLGHLVVQDGESVYSFGQKVSEAPLTARINIHDASAYTQILFGGATGSGEAYIRGVWTSPELTDVVRIFVLNQEVLSTINSHWTTVAKVMGKVAGWLRLNTLAGSRKNIAAHYDLSNEFFSLFLDSSMMYSSAVFPEENIALADASLIKLEHICRRLDLQESDHLVEIGAGWGGMAVYAAKHYGCRVTTTTISQKQYDMAVAHVKQEGVEDRVTVLLKDYRELQGEYDKLVSIEMVEAVGHQFYGEFFSRCSHLLKPEGLMLMQAITTLDQRFEREKHNIDFIQKYIFPGGCLPSNAVVMQNIAKHTDMHLVGLEDITLDYAITLKAWKDRFFEQLEHVKALGFDDRFVRMWDFYLSYCEGGFRERVINTSQFLFAKPLCRNLPTVGESAFKPLFN